MEREEKNMSGQNHFLYQNLMRPLILNSLPVLNEGAYHVHPTPCRQPFFTYDDCVLCNALVINSI